MLQQRIAAVGLPKAIQGPVDDLVRALNIARTREELEREGAMEVSSIFGLETAKRLRAADVEALYIIFDDAVQARLCKLSADCNQ